jgi:hypothetical protein
MRRPNSLPALMAGAVLMAFLPLDDAAAVESDPATRKEVRQYVLNSLDAHYKKALHYLEIGFCPEFREQLRWFDKFDDEYVRELAREYKAYLSRVDRLEFTQLAKERARELGALDCPPKGQTETASSNLTVSIGGGFSSLWVPTIPGGLKIDDDTETSVARSEGQLNGGSAKFDLRMPVYHGSIFINGELIELDGSSQGSVAPGDTPVGFVYAAPDPDGEFASVFPGAVGQHVGIKTEVELFNISAGLSAPLNIFPSSWQGQAAIGVRYANLDRTDRTTLSTPEDEDLSLTNRSNLDTDFVGPELGLAVERRQDGVGYFTPNIVGFQAAVAFVGSNSSATVRSSSTFADTQTAKFNDDDFSLILTAGLNVGWSVSQHVTVQTYANVEHFTDAPYVLAQGVGVGPIIEYDDMTAATIGAGLKIDW